MAEEVLAIATKIRSTRDQLLDLFDVVESKSARKKISTQLRELDDQVMRLISIAIDDSTKEYKKATSELGKANTKLTQAMEDQQKIADALTAVATAIGFVAKITALG